MVRKLLFALTLAMVLSAGVVSASQLRSAPGVLGVCHGTCSLQVTCFGTCFCYKGFCVSELPGQARKTAVKP